MTKRGSLFVARLVWLALVISMLIPALTRASDLADFNIAVAEAYRYYRAASFYFRTENTGVAAFELKRMQAKWQTIMGRFADSPPDAFSADPRWSVSLAEISNSINKALAAANSGDVATGKSALAEIQQALSALRKRNSVRVFADSVDELNAAIAALSFYVQHPPDFDATEEKNEIKGAAAVVAYLARKCRVEAPPAYRTNEDFARLIEEMLEALGQMTQAVDRKDRKAAIGYIRVIRSYNRMLSLRFG